MHNQIALFHLPDDPAPHPQSHESMARSFLVTGVQRRHGRRGRIYRMVALRDARGPIRAFAHADCPTVRPGQTVQVSGRIRFVDGERELLIRTMQPIDQERTRTRDAVTIDQDRARLAALMREIRPPYRALVEQIVSNEPLFGRFCRAPASRDHHHAYAGGLLRHTIEVMEFGLTLRPWLPVTVDPSLLLTAGFVHDLGKIDAYTAHPPYELTARGAALGHDIVGLGYLLPLLDQTPSLPAQLGARLLSTLCWLPSHDPVSIPPERQVLITLDGLSVQLAQVDRSVAA